MDYLKISLSSNQKRANFRPENQPLPHYFKYLTMKSSLQDYLTQKIDQRKAKNAYRSLTTDRYAHDFLSNDYLGLSKEEELRGRIAAASGKAITGSGGSRLLGGNSVLAEETEKELATYFGQENTLLFSSGYMANLALLATLPDRHSIVLYDQLSHACIKDGIRLSQAKSFPFLHNHLPDLEKKLQKYPDHRIFVVVESLYSMDGDFAPLAGLIALKNKYGFHLLVDEAHSTGIYGRGRGYAAELGFESQCDAIIYTFGKAMGCHGAVIAGTRLVIGFLVNYSRPFIYTTALPAHALIAIRESFRYLQQHPEIIDQLFARIRHYNACAGDASVAPIKKYIFDDIATLKQKAIKLQQAGYGVKPILSPTVPAGTERLRICLHAFNTFGEIEGLISLLHEE